MKFEKIYSDITRNRNEVFYKLYVEQYGDGILTSIPDNFENYYLCVLSLHCSVSKVVYKKFNNLYIQNTEMSSVINNINELNKIFGVKTYDKFNKFKLDFTNSDLICDNIYKHTPVNTFGMLCKNTYEKFLKL